jgi:hypothetical protein
MRIIPYKNNWLREAQHSVRVALSHIRGGGESCKGRFLFRFEMLTPI